MNRHRHDYDEDYDDVPDEVERPRDAAIDEALPVVLKLFEDAKVPVFYSTQIESRLERQFFHWITVKALNELHQGGELQRAVVVVDGRPVHFFALRGYRYWSRERKRMEKLLAKLFDGEFTQAVGRQGEFMFDAAFARHGFTLHPEFNVKAWQGRVWTKTGHNLDRIALRDGLAYGVEIKNTQNYIKHEELQVKLELCHHLGLVPLFIMRFAPKSYINEVRLAGGFTLLFEEQIYPWGHGALVTEVRQVLGLKVDSPRAIKSGTMERLLNWHERQLARGKKV